MKISLLNFQKDVCEAFSRINDSRKQPFEYVDLYQVAELVCKKNKWTMKQFEAALVSAYSRSPIWFSLQPDASPLRISSIRRRKPENRMDLPYYSIGINAKTISKLLSEINAENQK